VKLVHLVGFITKQFVTMQHGHVNVKFMKICSVGTEFHADGQTDRQA